MKPKSLRGLASALSMGALSSIVFTGRGEGAIFTKADNTTTLDLAASWGGTAPGAADIANWSGTYNTAGSLAAALPAGSLTWQGITAGGISGTAAGLVSIGGTGTAVVGSVLSVGSSGISLTGANQDLVINAATLALSGSQTWTVPAGRNLRLGSAALTSNVDGAGGNATVITVAGGGVVDANQGATNGFADFTGKWIVGSGATLRGVQSGTAAWGSNASADAILLNGGKLAVGGMTGAAGNWTWPTPITLGTGTTSSISGQNPDTSVRTLALQGAISGDGNLVFEKPAGGTLRLSLDQDSNTFTGTTTVNGSGVGVSANLTIQGLLGTTGGLKTPLGTGAITVNSGATLEFKTAAASTAAVTIANNINLNSATLVSRDALQTYSGNIALTGANTIQGAVDLKHTTLDGAISGAGSVTIRSNGTQQMILQFPNSYTGGTILGNNTSNDGIVVLGDTNSLGTGPVTLRGAQIRASVAGLTIANALVVGQSGTGGGFCVGGSNGIAFTSPAVVDNASRPFLNSGTGAVTMGNIDLTSGTSAVASFGSSTAKGAFNVNGAITGTGKVEIKGGTVTLAGASTYTGTTAISSVGRLNLSGSLTSDLSMTGTSAVIAGSGSTTGSFTTTGTSGGTILLDPANPTIAISAGAVNFSGATKVDLLNQQALGTTTYTVIKYGSLAGLVNLTSSTLRGTFNDDVANKKVTLAVTSANRTWNHAVNTTWNLADANWTEGDNKYFNGDAVTFGDTGAGDVTVSGIVSPFSVTFNNSAGSDYTLNSSTNNQISGLTGLTKSGTGNVLLVGENKFTGKVAISGGILAIRADNTLGAAPANPVADQISLNGGTLKLVPLPAGNLTVGANRGITLGASGAIIDTTEVTSPFTGAIAGEIVGSGPLVIYANGDTSDTGGGFPGAAALPGFNTFTGLVTIKSGVVTMDSWFGDSANVVLLDGGGLVDQNKNVFFNQDIQVGPAGGVLRSYGSATTSFAGALANAAGVASAVIRRTDGGTQIFTGNGSGFQGSFINSRGITEFDSENWSGMNLINVDGGQVRFGSGAPSKVKSITTDVDLHIEFGTILDITSGNFTVQPGVASGNFWVQNDGSLTSSSGVLNFNFQTAFTEVGADDQSVRVLIEDFNGTTPLKVVKNGPGGMNNVDKANTYTGGTTINGGRVSAQNGGAFGSGEVSVKPGGQAFLGLAGASFNNLFTIEGVGPSEPAGNLGALRFVNNTVSGDVTIAAAGARIVGYGGNTGSINGEIKGTGNLEINSATANHNGTITLNGASASYTGTITVAQGRLNLENSQSGTVTVADGATLGGEGIMSGTLNLGVSSGANLRVLGGTEFALQTTNLVLKGINNVHLDSSPAEPGPIKVVEFTNLTSGGVANLQMAPGSNIRSTFTNTGTAIVLNIVTSSRTWSGAVNGNWNSTDLNWVEGDQKFYTGDSVTFNDSATTKTIAIPAPVSPASVLFNNSTGNDYSVNGRMNIPSTGSLTKQGTGSLTLAGTPSAINGPVLVQAGTMVLSTTDYQRAVGLSTGIEVGAAILRINGINVLYDGAGGTNVTVNTGGIVELNAYHNHFKTLNLNGGTIHGIRTDAATRYNNEYSTFDSLVTVGGSQMSTISRAVGATGVYSLGGATFDVGDAVAGTDLLVAAPLIGGALIKDGPGTMTLTLSSSYSGGTTVYAGTLLANNASGSATGTGAVLVEDTATLGGTGAITGPVTVATGGTLAPGASIESLATGALSLAAGSIFRAEINSSGVPAADVVNVTGNITLAATLNVADLAGPPAGIAAGTKLTLISYTGTLTGTFAGLAEEATVIVGSNTFKIRYNDAKKVTLESMGTGGGSDYDTWSAAFAPLGGPTADDDGDGLSNSGEYAFGTNPKNGGSVSPVTVQLSKTGGTFTYIRRKPSLTGLTFKVWTSDNLSSWSLDTGAIQTPTDVGDNQNVSVTLSGPKPLTAPKLFVRVTAE